MICLLSCKSEKRKAELFKQITAVKLRVNMKLTLFTSLMHVLGVTVHDSCVHVMPKKNFKSEATFLFSADITKASLFGFFPAILYFVFSFYLLTTQNAF